MTFHVSCSVDAYIPHSAALLSSVLDHRGDDELVVHYLHGPEFPRDATGRLAGMFRDVDGAELVFHEIEPERVAGLGAPDYFSTANWYRIFLPELVPEADRVLYVDTDAVLADELRLLMTTDLGDCYLGAVDNVRLPWLDDRAAQLGLPAGQRYFNSGVLLMNLAAMRRDDAAKAVLDYARAEGDRLYWVDQDALNVVLGDRRLSLHPRWNAMNAILAFPAGVEAFGAEAVEEARRRPGIRHWEGPATNKPWHYEFAFDDRELYFRYRAAGPWPRVRLEGVPRRAVGVRLRQALGGLRA